MTSDADWLYIHQHLLKLFGENGLQNTPRRINHYLDVILRDGQKKEPPLDVEFIESRFKVRSKQIEQVEQQMDGTHLTVLKQIDSTLKQIQKDSKPLFKRLFGKS